MSDQAEYLKVMGVSQWVSRYQLVGAAPSPVVFESIEQPVLNNASSALAELSLVDPQKSEKPQPIQVDVSQAKADILQQVQLTEKNS